MTQKIAPGASLPQVRAPPTAQANWPAPVRLFLAFYRPEAFPDHRRPRGLLEHGWPPSFPTLHGAG